MKSYCSLGLMSGTSADGVDASIIQSDGDTEYKVILDKYFRYSQAIYENIHNLKDKINNSKDLNNLSKEIQSLEKEITLFHAKAANEITKKCNSNIDLIGFHGQTIFHNAKEKISKQLGDGKLLSKLTKKKVVYDFRQNDLKNGGQGAPLTPIFHKMLAKKLNLKNVAFINIGGIINATTINDDGYFEAEDIGPGMCLIDKWIRTNSKKKYDVNGDIAKSGKINNIILDQALDNFRATDPNRLSYDISDFDFLFASVRDLSLEDGAATLTEYTAQMILLDFRFIEELNIKEKIILCGGGRKNKFLVKKLKKNSKRIQLIDEHGVDGDFVEAQAFAYLAIRSYLNLPISFPETTGVREPCNGGTIVKNF